MKIARIFDPRKYLAESQIAMRDIVIARYEAFGRAGNAPKIKAISLDDISLRYLSGELPEGGLETDFVNLSRRSRHQQYVSWSLRE